MALKIGTRGSPLARWQSDWVADQLRAAGHEVELVVIATRGDKAQAGPISAIAGGDGVFTKELQRALLDHEIDLAVHSLKDLPTAPVAGLALMAVPPRASSCDALLSRESLPFDQLPQGATIGTGSLRRRAQLLNARPDLKMADLRGNIDTRLRKLREGQYDAICLAEAGLDRLRLAEHVTQVFPRSLMLPAVGQGALGVEGRGDDEATRRAVSTLDDLVTHAAVLAERSMLATLCGGCLAPIGAWGRVSGDQLKLDGVVLSADGRRRLYAAGQADTSDPKKLGKQVAEQLLAQGAAELIEQCRAS
ncbi:MAG: hydroxymethylbilane synthase [Planctomycetes bacterium]|nr:hydroxymethylbilane synthase [Planctomycetota bacterium]